MKGISLKFKKKEKGLPYSRYFSISIICLSLTSCSWISSRRSLFGEDESEKTKSKVVTTVPKEQYDQLLKRYESLLQKKKPMSKSMNSSADTFRGEDPSMLVDQLNKVGGQKAELAETVDVFGKKGIVSQSMDPNKGREKPVTYGEVESQIQLYKKGMYFFNKNRFDQALTIFKELEKSPVKQVRVRSKFQIGEMLFKQKEFDLSMQIFEEIIQKDAFSGIVIKVLGRLIVCSEKLKLTKKRERYYSILHDFFEAS